MDFFQLVTQFGFPLAALVVVVIGFGSGVVVPGFVYRDALAQRDRALDVAERLTTAAELATTVAERVVQHRVRR